MSGVGRRDEGIAPIPAEARTLSAIDQAVLWGSLGVSLLTIATGAYLTPALSVPRALAAVLLGGVVAATLIGAVGAIGAREGVPGMVLLRRALGVRGSAVPTVLNVAQNVGWGVFETVVVAEAAAQVVGGSRTAWIPAAGALATVLAALGPRSLVRRVLRRAAAPLVAVALGYVLVRFAADADLGRSGEGGLSFVGAVDLVIAYFVSWLPLVADYTRYARSPRAAAVGAGGGYLVGATLTLAVGVLGAAAAAGGDRSGYVAAILALPVGTAAAAVLVADETEKSFANVYSTAVSLQNLAPRLPLRVATTVTGLAVTLGALAVTMDRYLTFLYLLGALFVPLFGAVLADRLRPAQPLGTLTAWAVGSVLYQWILPTGPHWMTSAVTRAGEAVGVEPAFGLGDLAGASLPALALAFAVRLAWPARARRAGAVRPAPAFADHAGRR